MTVIETASENPFPQISTSVVYLLGFPSENADKQAFSYGILWFMMNYKATHSFTFTANRHPYPNRSIFGKDGPHLGSHQLSIIVVYFYKLRLLKWFRTTARLSRFKIPVEILSSPYYCKRSFIARSMFLAASFLAASSRLSYNFLPRQSPTLTLALPFLK